MSHAAATYYTDMANAAMRAQAARELDRINGVGYKPEAGCQVGWVKLGDVDVLVEYEVIRAERETRTDPGCPAMVVVCHVLLNGHKFDPRDILAKRIVERWEQELSEGGEL